MKKTIKSLIIIVLLSLSANSAELEKIFRLKDAEYGNVTTKTLYNYKINEDIMLAMQLGYNPEKNWYYGSRISGILKKNDLKKWSFQLDFYRYTNSYVQLSVEFKDENGLSNLIDLKGEKPHIFNTKSLSHSSIPVESKLLVVCFNNKFQVLLNDKKLYEGFHRFGALKEFNIKINDQSAIKDISLNELVSNKK